VQQVAATGRLPPDLGGNIHLFRQRWWRATFIPALLTPPPSGGSLVLAHVKLGELLVDRGMLPAQQVLPRIFRITITAIITITTTTTITIIIIIITIIITTIITTTIIIIFTIISTAILLTVTKWDDFLLQVRQLANDHKPPQLANDHKPPQLACAAQASLVGGRASCPAGSPACLSILASNHAQLHELQVRCEV
jgi:hypothetical protein